MKTRRETIAWAKDIDRKYADFNTKYGAYKEDGNWIINLWQPLAKNVNIIIYDKDNHNEEIKTIKGRFISPNWTWVIQEDLDKYFYQYEITQNNGRVTRALDPFAKSMAAFNWESKETNVGKAAFVSFQEYKKFFKLNKISGNQPIIYEAHTRDLTSLKKNIENKGSFNAIKKAKIAEHLKAMGFSAIQLLPVHSCYSINENDKNILLKNEGSKWSTNYNWGYDPHNYFSLNGWYSSNPKNPYSRMEEFKNLVQYMHSHNVNVIIDVVYNHLMTNSILNNIFPDYYFRGGTDKEKIVKPVSYPALASERAMCRRIIIESLEWFVKAYDIDGFRFDLSCFTDKETIYQIAKRLRKIKPNLVLHGEAWQWSDLDYNDSLIKGVTDNDIDFAYFNDTTRNSVKGEDDGEGFALGILNGNIEEEFDKYLSSIIGNIKEFKNTPKDMAKDSYSHFTSSANNNLQYLSCHDGHTLWDKINLTVKGNKTKKFEIYRQAILLLITTQGRILFQGGTELLYTKPNDPSGQDGNRFHKSDLVLDLFNLGNEYNENTYKTTDFSNGIRWEHLKNNDIKSNIYNFLKKSILFRRSTRFFNLSSEDEINNSIKFIYINKEKGIIDFQINVGKKTLRVIHNLKNSNYKYKTNGKIIIDSKIKKHRIGFSEPNSSQIIEVYK